MLSKKKKTRKLTYFKSFEVFTVKKKLYSNLFIQSISFETKDVNCY